MFIYRESVDFVLDELRAYEKGTDTYIIDGHFMPYSRLSFEQNILFKGIVSRDFSVCFWCHSIALEFLHIQSLVICF
jgi:hypothetical protein